jgi:hypothetical protein
LPAICPKRPASERCQTALVPCRNELRNASESVGEILDATRSSEDLAGACTWAATSRTACRAARDGRK